MRAFKGQDELSLMCQISNGNEADLMMASQGAKGPQVTDHRLISQKHYGSALNLISHLSGPVPTFRCKFPARHEFDR